MQYNTYREKIFKGTCLKKKYIRTRIYEYTILIYKFANFNNSRCFFFFFFFFYNKSYYITFINCNENLQNCFDSQLRTSITDHAKKQPKPDETNK